MSEFTQIFEAYNDLCKKLENISCKSLVDVIKQPAEGQKKIAMKIAMLLIMHRNDALKEFAENGIFTSIVDIYDRSGQQQLKGLCDDFISLAASRVKEQGSDFEGAINFMDSLLGISASLQVLIAKKALEAVDGALRQSEMLGQASIQTQYIQMLAENLSFQKNTTDQELKDKETRQNDLQSDIILGRQSNQSKYRSLCVLFHMIKNNASSNSSIIPVSSTSAQQSASAAAASSASQEALIASLRWVDPIYPILQQLNYKQKEEEDNLVSTGASKVLDLLEKKKYRPQPTQIQQQLNQLRRRIRQQEQILQQREQELEEIHRNGGVIYNSNKQSQNIIKGQQDNNEDIYKKDVENPKRIVQSVRRQPVITPSQKTNTNIQQQQQQQSPNLYNRDSMNEQQSQTNIQTPKTNRPISPTIGHSSSPQLNYNQTSNQNSNSNSQTNPYSPSLNKKIRLPPLIRPSSPTPLYSPNISQKQIQKQNSFQQNIHKDTLTQQQQQFLLDGSGLQQQTNSPIIQQIQSKKTSLSSSPRQEPGIESFESSNSTPKILSKMNSNTVNIKNSSSNNSLTDQNSSPKLQLQSLQLQQQSTNEINKQQFGSNTNPQLINQNSDFHQIIKADEPLSPSTIDECLQQLQLAPSCVQLSYAAEKIERLFLPFITWKTAEEIILNGNFLRIIVRALNGLSKGGGGSWNGNQGIIIQQDQSKNIQLQEQSVKNLSNQSQQNLEDQNQNQIQMQFINNTRQQNYYAIDILLRATHCVIQGRHSLLQDIVDAGLLRIVLKLAYTLPVREAIELKCQKQQNVELNGSGGGYWIIKVLYSLIRMLVVASISLTPTQVVLEKLKQATRKLDDTQGTEDSNQKNFGQNNSQVVKIGVNQIKLKDLLDRLVAHEGLPWVIARILSTSTDLYTLILIVQILLIVAKSGMTKEKQNPGLNEQGNNNKNRNQQQGSASNTIRSGKELNRSAGNTLRSNKDSVGSGLNTAKSLKLEKEDRKSSSSTLTKKTSRIIKTDFDIQRERLMKQEYKRKRQTLQRIKEMIDSGNKQTYNHLDGTYQMKKKIKIGGKEERNIRKMNIVTYSNKWIDEQSDDNSNEDDDSMSELSQSGRSEDEFYGNKSDKKVNKESNNNNKPGVQARRHAPNKYLQYFQKSFCCDILFSFFMKEEDRINNEYIKNGRNQRIMNKMKSIEIEENLNCNAKEKNNIFDKSKESRTDYFYLLCASCLSIIYCGTQIPHRFYSRLRSVEEQVFGFDKKEENENNLISLKNDKQDEDEDVYVDLEKKAINLTKDMEIEKYIHKREKDRFHLQLTAELLVKSAPIARSFGFECKFDQTIQKYKKNGWNLERINEENEIDQIGNKFKSNKSMGWIQYKGINTDGYIGQENSGLAGYYHITGLGERSECNEELLIRMIFSGSQILSQLNTQQQQRIRQEANLDDISLTVQKALSGFYKNNKNKKVKQEQNNNEQEQQNHQENSQNNIDNQQIDLIQKGKITKRKIQSKKLNELQKQDVRRQKLLNGTSEAVIADPQICTVLLMSLFDNLIHDIFCPAFVNKKNISDNSNSKKIPHFEGKHSIQHGEYNDKRIWKTTSRIQSIMDLCSISFDYKSTPKQNTENPENMNEENTKITQNETESEQQSNLESQYEIQQHKLGIICTLVEAQSLPVCLFLLDSDDARVANAALTVIKTISDCGANYARALSKQRKIKLNEGESEQSIINSPSKPGIDGYNEQKHLFLNSFDESCGCGGGCDRLHLYLDQISPDITMENNEQHINLITSQTSQKQIQTAQQKAIALQWSRGSADALTVLTTLAQSPKNHKAILSNGFLQQIAFILDKVENIHTQKVSELTDAQQWRINKQVERSKRIEDNITLQDDEEEVGYSSIFFYHSHIFNLVSTLLENGKTDSATVVKAVIVKDLVEKHTMRLFLDCWKDANRLVSLL